MKDARPQPQAEFEQEGPVQDEVQPPRLEACGDSEKRVSAVVPRQQPVDVADDAIKADMNATVHGGKQQGSGCGITAKMVVTEGYEEQG